MTTEEKIEICRRYGQQIVRRDRPGARPLAPAGFEPDWGDQPSRFKIYRDANRIPLSPWLPLALGPTHGSTQGEVPYECDPFDRLAAMLRLANGPVKRKLDMNWNLSHGGDARFAYPTCARATASGGGLYPVEYYLLALRANDLLPGVYHYDSAHDALERLAAADIRFELEEATFGAEAVRKADYVIVLAVDFWKNYFKYCEFCYHVVTQDCGAALSTLLQLGERLGTAVDPLYWFDDRAINRLVGLDTVSESAMILVSLGKTSAQAAVRPEPPEPPRRPAIGNKRSYQRSKRVFRLPRLVEVHSATLVDRPHAGEDACGEATDAPAPPAAGAVRLPATDGIPGDLLGALAERESSWGRLRRQPAVTLEQLASLLAYVEQQQVRIGNTGTGGLTRLAFYAHNVRGLQQGVYNKYWKHRAAGLVRSGNFALALQRLYRLGNYNLEQVAVVIAVIGNPELALARHQNRGLRVLNAEVGAVAQSLYLGCSALALGAGAALGFRNEAVNELLRIDGTDETSMLLFFIGNQAQPLRASDWTFLDRPLP